MKSILAGDLVNWLGSSPIELRISHFLAILEVNFIGIATIPSSLRTAALDALQASSGSAGIIDVRAVQDIWITYPKEPAKERGIGTSVRFFDNKSKMWRVVFVSPAHGALTTMQGRYVLRDYLMVEPWSLH